MTPKGSEDVPTVKKGPKNRDELHPRPTPALTIVSHPLPQRTGERMVLDALMNGHPVALSRNAPDFMHPGGGLAQPLADQFLSRSPLVLTSRPEGGIRLEPSEGCSVSIAGVPLHGPRVVSAQEVAEGVALELADRVVVLLHLADPKARTTADTLGMVGNSLGVQNVREQIERVADLDVPVLIRGETGSGKELIAQAIYKRSRRRERPFVSVNLGAIPKELAQAELFGAVKGAYSGAVKDREGLFRAAHGGTLFLDEVGEASLEVQVMLLRVLETRDFLPVGSHTPVSTDVRLITATDAHLEEQIQKGRFKEPLLHRLGRFQIRVPPLRARREDIGPLFLHFVREEMEALGEGHRLGPTEDPSEPWLPASLASLLVRYPWPGNIRELRNVALQIVISNRGQAGGLRLDPQMEPLLFPPVASHVPPPPPEPPPPGPSRRKLSDFSEEQLLAALKENSWEIKPAAEQLGVARSSLQDWYQRNVSPTPEEFTRSYQECHQDVHCMSQRLRMSYWVIVRRLRELGLSWNE